MSAKQGQEYRIVNPSALAIRRGQPDPDRFIHRFTDEDGNTVVVVDIIGDVIYASENVDYPRGPQQQYRHVDWIDEHPERFELIETD